MKKTILQNRPMLKCTERRPLNGHELASLEDREYIRSHAKILTGYELSDKELDNMINEIKSSQL